MLNTKSNLPIGIKKTGLFIGSADVNTYTRTPKKLNLNQYMDYTDPTSGVTFNTMPGQGTDKFERDVSGSTSSGQGGSTSSGQGTNAGGATSSKQSGGTDPDPGVKIEKNGFDAKPLMSAISDLTKPLTNAAYQNSGVAGFGASDTTNQIRTSIADAAISSGNPYAMAIGLATKAVDGVVDVAGGRAADYTNAQLDALGLGKDVKAANWAGHIMNSFPGSALLFGNIATKKLSNAEISQDTEKVRNAYAGTLNKMDAAAELGGTGMAWYFRKAQNKMQAKIDELNERNNKLTGISRTNTLAKQNNYSQELNAQNQNRYSGGSGTMALGRHGMELPDKHMIAMIFEARTNMPKKGTETTSDESEKLPGIDTNVIPEGALHAHKNHLEEQNEELDKVTEKGIPVIVTDEKGNYEQLAEIEKEEIIFRLKLTKKIEELMEDGSEKAMIRAGKILAKEIMCNTDDNTDEFLDGDD